MLQPNTRDNPCVSRGYPRGVLDSRGNNVLEQRLAPFHRSYGSLAILRPHFTDTCLFLLYFSSLLLVLVLFLTFVRLVRSFLRISFGV